MKCRLVKIDNLSGSKATLYSVSLEEEKETLLEKFVRENKNLFLSETKDILKRFTIMEKMIMKNNKSNVIDELLGTITPEEQAKTDAKMLLAAKISDAMKAKGWKNKDLLKAMGKNNPSEITKWLSGTHNFTVEKLVELENVLNVKLLNLNDQKEETVTRYHFIVKSQPVGESRHHSVNDLIHAEPAGSLFISYPVGNA
jgi:transcriptional regulator with XRE-family HTH domain